MKAYRARHPATEEESFWPSFTDVMSSITFVLFFLILLMFIQQIVTSKAWDDKLAKANQDLSTRQGQLSEVNKALSGANGELDKKKAEINSLGKTLDEREQQINSLQQRVESDQAVLQSKENELMQVNTKLQEISVLRLNILTQVKQSIEQELGKDLENNNGDLVQIDDNANLLISSNLLFAKGSSEISSSGAKLVQQFSAAFARILKDQEVRKNIDSIIISGYADSDDSFQNNYALSCERAIAVINAMMKANPTLENTYGSYFQASGFSEFRPVASGDDEASKSKNRRIQISIDIKDSNIQEIIKDYMSPPNE